MNVIGYGICGPGESKRYMRETLDEFKRLCDDTIILCNNVTKDEISLISEYGFKIVYDDREWGINQWKIKQDFLQKHVSKLKPDFCVCLDMDEVFSKELTREWIETAPFDAYHVYIVDIWNDREHYKAESCFWNVRMFRWNGDVKFKEKPVHCGLAPQWAYFYHRFAPFILKHYGLMDPADREKKIERYEKYDPNAKHMERKYYRMLADDKADIFNEETISAIITKEVETYQQTKPRKKSMPVKKRFAYLKNPHGVVVDVPEAQVRETLARPGFEFISWVEDNQEEIEQLFDGVDTNTTSTEDSANAPSKLKREEGSESRTSTRKRAPKSK